MSTDHAPMTDDDPTPTDAHDGTDSENDDGGSERSSDTHATPHGAPGSRPADHLRECEAFREAWAPEPDEE